MNSSLASASVFYGDVFGPESPLMNIEVTENTIQQDQYGALSGTISLDITNMLPNRGLTNVNYKSNTASGYIYSPATYSC